MSTFSLTVSKKNNTRKSPKASNFYFFFFSASFREKTTKKRQKQHISTHGSNISISLHWIRQGVAILLDTPYQDSHIWRNTQRQLSENIFEVFSFTVPVNITKDRMVVAQTLQLDFFLQETLYYC